MIFYGDRRAMRLGSRDPAEQLLALLKAHRENFVLARRNYRDLAVGIPIFSEAKRNDREINL